MAEKKSRRQENELDTSLAKLLLQSAISIEALKSQGDRTEEVVNDILKKFSNGFKQEIIDAMREGNKELLEKLIKAINNEKLEASELKVTIENTNKRIDAFCKRILVFIATTSISLVITLIIIILQHRGIL